MAQPIADKAFCLIISMSNIGFGADRLLLLRFSLFFLDDFRDDLRLGLRLDARRGLRLDDDDDDELDELLESELLLLSESEVRLCERFFLL